ncbi:MAG: hypothetical protein C4582_01475 [Desulfobacteraceae bacterium]|jgi:hypothetical protein|nr:MAG: hypothetical protein C4582_01475 [Desulfobacteraceae bacterium]
MPEKCFFLPIFLFPGIVIKLGSASGTEVQAGLRSSALAWIFIIGFNMNPAHGAFEPAHRALDYPFQGFHPLTVQFELVLLSSVFKNDAQVVDFAQICLALFFIRAETARVATLSRA